MPLYFFDVINGHRLADPAGLDCADDEEAKIHATEIAKLIAEEVPRSAKQRHIAIRDTKGRQVASIEVGE